MRGHIRKRGETWSFIVELGNDAQSGRRRQKEAGGFRTRREAQRALAEALHQLNQGTYVEPSRQPLSEYLEEWLKGERLRLRPGAYDVRKLHVDAYIAPRIGHLPLNALTRPKVRALYADLRESGRVRSARPLSAKTVHNIHRTLSRALADAVRDRLIPGNVAEGAHSQPDSPEQATWDAVQLRSFLEHVRDDRFAALWRVAATTVLRRGERVGLRWSDVDLERGQLSIAQQRAKGAGTVIAGPTKTRRSRRLLPLDAATVDALRRHRKEQDVERGVWGEAYEDHALVFCLENGRPLHPDAVTSRLRLIARKLGLPWIKVHGLRHTYATLLLKAGVHPKVVQERLGHGSISITMDTYSHAIPAMQSEAADLGAALIDGAEHQQPDAPRGEQ